MKLHLPLNAVDRVNRPPVFYLTVQDGLILTSSFLWTISYLLYVRQAFRDRNYGMPLVPL
jgi:paspaline synthase